MSTTGAQSESTHQPICELGSDRRIREATWVHITQSPIAEYRIIIHFIGLESCPFASRFSSDRETKAIAPDISLPLPLWIG